jgi:hypothetical protein
MAASAARRDINSAIAETATVFGVTAGSNKKQAE